MDKFLLKKRPAGQSDSEDPMTLLPKAKRSKTTTTSAVTPTMSAKKKKRTTTSTKKGAGKIAGKTLEQHRRAMGDQVKSQISVEKWCIAARTHCTIENVEPEVFEKLILANASSVVPAVTNANEGDDDDNVIDTICSTDNWQSLPVIVASVQGSDKMAAIFGATKIKGGTRIRSWTADQGECIYLPASKTLRVWWTMC